MIDSRPLPRGNLPKPTQRETTMAVDTFMAYVGVYPSVEQAEADYQLVKDLHTQAGMMDAYDAAVIEKRTGRQSADHQEA